MTTQEAKTLIGKEVLVSVGGYPVLDQGKVEQVVENAILFNGRWLKTEVVDLVSILGNSVNESLSNGEQLING